jgi:hypothetical protein
MPNIISEQASLFAISLVIAHNGIGEKKMDEKKVTKQTLQDAQRGGRKLVYNKQTGQFEVLKSYEAIDASKQTEMTPSNIPNA